MTAAELRAVSGRDSASLMTLLEQRHYMARDPGAMLNFTWGYPLGLNPAWVTDYQMNPPAGFLDRPAADYAAVIRRYFERFFAFPSADAPLFGYPDVHLTPTCTMAFVIAARALIRSPADELVLLDTSYDSYPRLLRSLGARVTYARRAPDGGTDPDAIRRACTASTKAVVLVCPDNPLGTVPSWDAMDQIADLCKERDITLLADYCLAAINPRRIQIPVVSRWPKVSTGLSYLLLGDTGKILGLAGSKFGAIICSDGWRERIEALASEYFFEFSQYDLYLLASILKDDRFATYSWELNGHVGGNLAWLQEQLAATPLTLKYRDAGSFGLVDAAGLGLDDVSYARLLRDEHTALVVPVSWFRARPGPETRVRISLARPQEQIARLAEALKDSASRPGRPTLC